MIALLRAVAPCVIAIALLGGSHWLAYRHGVTTTEAALTGPHKAELADRDKANALATTAAVDKARKEERDAAQRIAEIDSQHQGKLDEQKANSTHLAAERDTGRIRLRERFACPSASTATVMPSTAAGASVGDEAAAHGLQRADEKFLVSESERSTEVAIQLQACQAIVRSDRGQP